MRIYINIQFHQSNSGPPEHPTEGISVLIGTLMLKASSIFLYVAMEALLSLSSFLTFYLEVQRTLHNFSIGSSLANTSPFDSITSNSATDWDASFVHEPA